MKLFIFLVFFILCVFSEIEPTGKLVDNSLKNNQTTFLSQVTRIISSLEEVEKVPLNHSLLLQISDSFSQIITEIQSSEYFLDQQTDQRINILIQELKASFDLLEFQVSILGKVTCDFLCFVRGSVANSTKATQNAGISSNACKFKFHCLFLQTMQLVGKFTQSTNEIACKMDDFNSCCLFMIDEKLAKISLEHLGRLKKLRAFMRIGLLHAMFWNLFSPLSEENTQKILVIFDECLKEKKEAFLEAKFKEPNEKQLHERAFLLLENVFATCKKSIQEFPVHEKKMMLLKEQYSTSKQSMEESLRNFESFQSKLNSFIESFWQKMKKANIKDDVNELKKLIFEKAIELCEILKSREIKILKQRHFEIKRNPEAKPF